MALTPQEIEAAPKITLGGKEFPIPLLVPRQQRIVIPKCMELFKTVTTDGKIVITNFSTAQFNDMYEIVHTALTRAHPDMTFDQFLDMDCTSTELIKSLITIAQQTGMMGFAKPNETPPSGEVAAASLPIGTASSQE